MFFLTRRRRRSDIFLVYFLKFIKIEHEKGQLTKKERVMRTLEENLYADIEKSNGDINIEEEVFAYFIGTSLALASGKNCLAKILNFGDYEKAGNNALEKWINEHLQEKES